ncbi:hypothetical protein [uncultured Tolumonas sp.]|uniref:hypothetical protein n=1 Tax=uncultured Tolumonas sp. TaxID=263765 RepID=UPI002931B421|nr:hypothetical protein [uncultured Tolumonas sp.]
MIKIFIILSIWLSSTLFVKINYYEVNHFLTDTEIIKLVFDHAYENAEPESRLRMDYTDKSLSLCDLKSTLSHLSFKDKNIHGFLKAINARHLIHEDENDLKGLTEKIIKKEPITYIYPCNCGDGSNYIAIPMDKIKIDSQLNIVIVPHIDIQSQYFNVSKSYLKETGESPILQAKLTYAVGLDNNLSLMSYKIDKSDASYSDYQCITKN